MYVLNNVFWTLLNVILTKVKLFLFVSITTKETVYNFYKLYCISENSIT